MTCIFWSSAHSHSGYGWGNVSADIGHAFIIIIAVPGGFGGWLVEA